MRATFVSTKEASAVPLGEACAQTVVPVREAHEELAARRRAQDDVRPATIEDFLSGAPGANFLMAASTPTFRRRPS